MRTHLAHRLWIRHYTAQTVIAQQEVILPYPGLRSEEGTGVGEGKYRKAYERKKRVGVGLLEFGPHCQTLATPLRV